MIIEKDILENMLDQLGDVGVIHEYQFKELMVNSTLRELKDTLEQESNLSLITNTAKLKCPHGHGEQWVNMIQNSDVFPNLGEAENYVQRLLKEMDN